MLYMEKYTLEEVFCKDSPVTQKVLLGYVKRHKVIEYKCDICGCDGSWQGGEISLELHHKDGDNSNNNISNLIFLCPNCHALTGNYRGKNKEKKVEIQVSDEVFIKTLHSTTNIRQCLIQLGLAPAGANYERAKKLLQEFPKEKSAKKVCIACGKPIFENRKQYCSQECAHKAQQKSDRPDRETLKTLIRTTPFTKIGDMFGVSDNSIRKWCKSMELPTTKKDISSYSEEEWQNI